MKYRHIVSFLFLGTTALAQTTWQDLEFGMDRQKATTALSTKQFSLLLNSNTDTATITPDFEVKTNSAFLSSNLRPAVASAPMFFAPELKFGSHGLETITLSLDQDKTFQATPALKGMKPLLAFIAGTSLYEQLTSKYGRPMSTRGPCENIKLASLVGSTTECTARWNASHQSVELHWDYRWQLQKLAFTVMYTGTESGL